MILDYLGGDVLDSGRALRDDAQVLLHLGTELRPEAAGTAKDIYPTADNAPHAMSEMEDGITIESFKSRVFFCSVIPTAPLRS